MVVFVSAGGGVSAPVVVVGSCVGDSGGGGGGGAPMCITELKSSAAGSVRSVLSVSSVSESVGGSAAATQR